MPKQKELEKGVSNTSIGEVHASPVIIKENNKPSTSVDERQESHNDSVASSDEQNDENYQIGDIVWAKIGKYPFWPSIVCCDPDSKTFMKGSPKDKKKFSLHVRFCYDNGRRCWAKMLSNYSGKDDLLTKYPNCLSSVKNSKRQMNSWNLAVKEADSWLKFDREERWIQFSNANNIKSPVTSPVKSSLSSSVAISDKLPDSTITANTNDTTHNVLDIKKKRKVIKKKTAKEIIHPLNTLSFSRPDDNYHIDDNDDPPLVPTHPQRKVMERLRFDIERLEAEGIRKVKDWNTSKLAKAGSSK